MDRSSVIYLISETWTPDEYGVMKATHTERKVFCDVTSITLSEWSEGGRNGLNPEFRMSMFSPNYHGEEILKYNGILYTIYRTYRAKNETIDLYVERRHGNGEDSSN